MNDTIDFLDSLTAPLIPTMDGLPVLPYDAIVIGAGVAGLAFTLQLPPDIRVALLTKGALGESNTRYAQGGLAAAVGQDDHPDLHFADTIVAGAGLCDEAAVHALVNGAPEAARWLIDLGANFDAGPDGVPLLGREAAHSRRRVLHAGGDATGFEIERALVARVREDEAVDVYAGAFALDLIVDHGACQGVVVQLASDGPLARLEAPLTVIAAGGAGRLWATTTNPAGATADGLAMALRAGVPVADTEFVQFHPTVLSLPDSDPFLVTEAIRGEGAYLRDANGKRFMEAIHPLAELAPRDVVARGVQRQMALDQTNSVSLDLRHLPADAMRERFPTIRGELAARGLDLATDLIPVAPAAHYFIGGAIAGVDGATALPGLLAIGEASCTGIHGANRLASNSLLEGLVFGMAGARRFGALLEPRAPGVEPAMVAKLTRSDATPTAAQSMMVDERRCTLQATMSQSVAVVRDRKGLEAAMETFAALAAGLDQPDLIPGRDLWELRNMLISAIAVTGAAVAREESRGAHFRSDHPEPDPTLVGQHSILGQRGWQYGTLGSVLEQSVV